MTKIDSVTILASFPPIKGITPYTLALVKELEKYVKVSVLSFKSIYPEFLYPGSTKDHSLKKPPLTNTKVYSFITWYNPISWIWAGLKVKGDVFHVQWWSWALAPMYLVIIGIAKLRGKQIVMTVHNVSPHERLPLTNFLTKVVYKMADKAIVHTEKNRNDLKKILKKTPIQVIPHGILKAGQSHSSKKEARGQLGISPEEKTLLFFGNIRSYKGLNVLLLALHKLKGDFKLIIAGECWEDWEKYQTIIDAHGLKERVLRIEGFIPEEKVELIFKAADLLVLPYKHFDAGTGVGALGLHYEMPLLVSDAAGLSELVIDEHFRFESGNFKALAHKIDWFFKQDQEFSEQIKTLKKKFMWEDIVQKTLNFYEQ